MGDAIPFVAPFSTAAEAAKSVKELTDIWEGASAVISGMSYDMMVNGIYGPNGNHLGPFREKYSTREWTNLVLDLASIPPWLGVLPSLYGVGYNAKSYIHLKRVPYEEWANSLPETLEFPSPGKE